MSFPDTVKTVLALGVVFVALPLHGQAPGTDIVILSMNEAAGEFHLQSLIRVTDRAGYDNQPHFLPGGEALLYTSIDGTGQADIYRYSISTGEHTRVTTSAPESEYSPTLIPGERRFSAIRVEADSAQRLWSFALDGSGAQVLLPEIAPVGYHAWGENEILALFVLGQPATLQLARPGPGAGEIKASNIGRSLHRIPGRNAFSFVQNVSPSSHPTTFISSIQGPVPLLTFPGQACPMNDCVASLSPIFTLTTWMDWVN